MEHFVFISHSSDDASIAQMICHQMEESGIPCWIAPRDVKHGDWAGEIMDGIWKSDVCIVVISGNSITSPEVLKEVTQATRSCMYILPFKVDDKELSPKLKYHLDPCHWLDATTPPMEQHIQELLERIQNLSDEDIVYINKRRQKLVDHMVWPKASFLGRDAELEEIARRLPEEHLLFLLGMGGIGKSEIAKSYAKKYHDRYDTVIFAEYEGSLLEMMLGDSIAIENLVPYDPETESPEQYFHRKLEVLRALGSDRTLLILDNYDVDQDPLFEEFSNGPYHLLITTRNEHDGYPVIKVGPFANFDSARELFLTWCGKKPQEEEMAQIDEILKLVDCHTITVEMIARQMKASRRKPKEMLELLKTGGINTHLKEKVKSEGIGTSGCAFDFIRKLFHFSNLSEECAKLLRYMAMVPYTGIDIRFFYDVCQLESYDAVNELIAHSWLMLDEDTDKLSMHPIVADVVREELKPNPANCADYIRGIHRVVGNLWFKTQEEKNREWPYYAYILTHYPEPIPELWVEYGDMACNAWICGRYTLSIEAAHRHLEFTKRQFPGDLHKLSQSALWLGGCYHNSGDDLNAEGYYELGLESQKACITDNSSIQEWEVLAVTYQKVGRCAYQRGDFEKSRKCLEESIKLIDSRETLSRFGGDTMVEMARMYIAMGQYENALDCCEKSLDLFGEYFKKEVPNHAYSYADMGKCYTHLSRFDEAEKALNEALRINIAFNGENSREMFYVREALADLAAAKGDTKTAVSLYTALEIEMEQDFGESNPFVAALRTKRMAQQSNT